MFTENIEIGLGTRLPIIYGDYPHPYPLDKDMHHLYQTQRQEIVLEHNFQKLSKYLKQIHLNI